MSCQLIVSSWLNREHNHSRGYFANCSVSSHLPGRKIYCKQSAELHKGSDKKASERKKTCFAGGKVFRIYITCAPGSSWHGFRGFHGHDFDFLYSIIFKRIGLWKRLQRCAKYRFACLNSVSKWLGDQLWERLYFNAWIVNSNGVLNLKWTW